MTQYLYLISCKSGLQTFYKIGIANDVESRLAQLQTGSPLELSIEECYSFDNSEIVEKAIHQAWKKQRVRGEWFELGGDGVEKFQEICSLLGGQVYVPDRYDTTQEAVEEAENDYVLTGGVDWRLEARFDRGNPGYAIMKRGKVKVYLGYICSSILKDPMRPTIQEVEDFLSQNVK